MPFELEDAGYRFETILRGIGERDCDRPLLKRADWVVAPTIGSVVPNWLLVIPRQRLLSFRNWTAATLINPVTLVRSVLDHLGLDESEAIWFEHGPSDVGTIVGCGLDHAHIHLLLRPAFGFAEFTQKAQNMCRLEWQSGAADEVYRNIAPGKSYLMVGSGSSAVHAEGVEIAGSQFLRRVTASLCGCDTTWDYKCFPHEENVAETIATFRLLEGFAQRGI